MCFSVFHTKTDFGVILVCTARFVIEETDLDAKLCKKCLPSEQILINSANYSRQIVAVAELEVVNIVFRRPKNNQNRENFY